MVSFYFLSSFIPLVFKNVETWIFLPAVVLYFFLHALPS